MRWPVQPIQVPDVANIYPILWIHIFFSSTQIFADGATMAGCNHLSNIGDDVSPVLIVEHALAFLKIILYHTRFSERCKPKVHPLFAQGFIHSPLVSLVDGDTHTYIIQRAIKASISFPHSFPRVGIWIIKLAHGWWHRNIGQLLLQH